MAEVYRRLAATKGRHAGFWEERLRAAGARLPERRPGWRTRLLIAVARRFGNQAVLPTLNDLERADSACYDEQPESRGTAMPAEERSHARLLRTLEGGAGVEGTALGRLEGRHRAASGNALRAAVLGANDGLLSNLSLVMGVAGAQVSANTVLITGLAGLLAGAGSMAMGEWVSVTSARELAGHQLETEAREIGQIPDEEREELALIYEAKGLDADQARDLAARQIAHRDLNERPVGHVVTVAAARRRRPPLSLDAKRRGHRSPRGRALRHRAAGVALGRALGIAARRARPRPPPRTAPPRRPGLRWPCASRAGCRRCRLSQLVAAAGWPATSADSTLAEPPFADPKTERYPPAQGSLFGP